jgi:hypothetical protein
MALDSTVCDFANCVSKRTLPVALGKWTPDSRGLIYADPCAPVDLWVQPLDGGVPRQLTRFPADGQQIWGFGWSDDRRLAVGPPRSRTTSSCFAG